MTTATWTTIIATDIVAGDRVRQGDEAVEVIDVVPARGRYARSCVRLVLAGGGAWDVSKTFAVTCAPRPA